MLENCFSCKAIGKYYPYEFYKSINEMEDLLNKLEKEEQKGEKENMIDNLSNKLIYIDNELNRLMLCEGCERKKSDKLMDKLTNTLNKLTNKSYLTVEITRLSNELLETLEMLENCSSCKSKIRQDGKNKSIYKIED